MNDGMAIAHHGIKGMKWGVRRSPAQLGHPIGQKRPKTISPERQARLDRKNALKNRRTMSTEELKERVARLENEKKLKELTEADLYPGKKAVNEALASIGKKVATTAASGAALYYLKYKASGDKKINRQELANAIFNGGAKKK